MERKPTFGASVSMKLNLGNYESADVWMSIGGVTEDTTPEEVARLLDGPARTSYNELRARLGARLQEEREAAERRGVAQAQRLGAGGRP